MSNSFIKYPSIELLEPLEQELVAQALKATKSAYAPYSNFRVGAAIRVRSGEILCGSNQESEVYPAGMCAERVVLYYAASQFAHDPIDSIAIISSPSQRECTPCGQCRQVLLDIERRQGSDIKVIMCSESSATIAPSAESLLPLSFEL